MADLGSIANRLVERVGWERFVSDDDIGKLTHVLAQITEDPRMLRAQKGDRRPDEMLEYLVMSRNPQATGYFNSLAILPKIVQNIRKRYTSYKSRLAIAVINAFHAETLMANEDFYREQYVHREHKRNLFGMTYAYAAEDLTRLTDSKMWTFKEELRRQAIRYLERLHEIDKADNGRETLYSTLRLATAYARLHECIGDQQEKAEVLRKSLAHFNLIMQNGWNIFARAIATVAGVCYQLGCLAPTQEQQEAYFARSAALFETAQKKAEAERSYIPRQLREIHQSLQALAPKS